MACKNIIKNRINGINSNHIVFVWFDLNLFLKLNRNKTNCTILYFPIQITLMSKLSKLYQKDTHICKNKFDYASNIKF